MEMRISLSLIRIEVWFFLYTFLSYMSLYSTKKCIRRSVCLVTKGRDVKIKKIIYICIYVFFYLSLRRWAFLFLSLPRSLSQKKLIKWQECIFVYHFPLFLQQNKKVREWEICFNSSLSVDGFNPVEPYPTHILVLTYRKHQSGQ